MHEAMEKKYTKKHLRKCTSENHISSLFQEFISLVVINIIISYALNHFLIGFFQYFFFYEHFSSDRLDPSHIFFFDRASYRQNFVWPLLISPRFLAKSLYSLMKPTPTWSGQLRGHDTL